MATLYTVLSALQAQVSAVTQGLTSNSPDTFGMPLTVLVGLYWPSAKALQNNVRVKNVPGGAPLAPTSMITIYDRGLAADSTRWLPTVVGGDTTGPPPDPTLHMSVTASEGYVQQLASMTLTFAGPVQIGDAVGLVFTQSFGVHMAAVVPIAVLGDTPTTMAAKAAAMLNAEPQISQWLTAVAVGPVVTLTSHLNTASVALAVNVGFGGSGTGTGGGGTTQLIEIARRKRHFLIAVWSRTPDDRITVTDPIEILIATLEADFGLTFADGTMGRLTFSGDVMHDDATLSDTMRRDFMVCVDYGINTIDTLYAVLAPIAQYTIL